MEQNPWKTPFGRVLIGSAIVAAVVGFSMAAGVMTYFRTAAADNATSDSPVSNSIPFDVEPVDNDQALDEAGNAADDVAAEAEAQPGYYSGGEYGEGAENYQENAAAEADRQDPDQITTDNSGDQE